MGTLRLSLGILHPVVYQDTASDAGTDVNPATLLNDDSEDLLQLESRELVDIIQKPGVELARKNSILNSARSLLSSD